MNYSVDERRIAHQTVDGEVIAIDFVSGAYFSMRSTAAGIWISLAANEELGAVIAFCQANSSVPAETVANEIRFFVSELLAANLLQANDTSDTVRSISSAVAAYFKPYAKPQLEKFEDMANLIMLDPVHDVGDAGWPHVPKRND